MRDVLLYFFFLACIMFTLYGINKLQDITGTVTVDNRAIDPDLLLGTSRTYARDHFNDRSLSHLKRAVEAIRSIEEAVDRESQEIIEEAIKPLEKVIEELSVNELEIYDMNQAFTAALNALTRAELKISEHLILMDKADEAALAMKYAQMHIKNALDYARDNDYNMELSIYAEIDSLMTKSDLDPEELIARMDMVIGELDSLVHEEVQSVGTPQRSNKEPDRAKEKREH